MLPIIVEYAPTDNKNALPDIPGKSRNEHAMKPIIIRKYKLNEKFS